MPKQRTNTEILDMLTDADGRFTRWPKKAKERTLILETLATAFEADAIYTEKQVNAILMERNTFGDHALLRRELFEGGYLTRNIDGTDYRATPFNAGKLDAQV